MLRVKCRIYLDTCAECDGVTMWVRVTQAPRCEADVMGCDHCGGAVVSRVTSKVVWMRGGLARW